MITGEAGFEKPGTGADQTRFIKTKIGIDNHGHTRFWPKFVQFSRHTVYLRSTLDKPKKHLTYLMENNYVFTFT